MLVLLPSPSSSATATSSAGALKEEVSIRGGPHSTKIETNEWLVWQLADSAFPTGGFAHSGGLEAACQHGELRNRAELTSFIETSLRQFGRGPLPFMTASYDQPERFPELDRLCEAFTT